jgi:hypothetical protein
VHESDAPKAQSFAEQQQELGEMREATRRRQQERRARQKNAEDVTGAVQPTPGSPPPADKAENPGVIRPAVASKEEEIQSTQVEKGVFPASPRTSPRRSEVEKSAHASGAGNQGAKKAKTALGFDL